MTAFAELALALLYGHAPARRRSPYELLGDWRDFVQSCIAGYAYDWYEFDNERRVRGPIQTLLDCAELRGLGEFDGWATQVSEVDAKYRTLLIPLPGLHEQPWWLGGVPAYAGPELAADIRSSAGVHVEVRQTE